MSATIVNIEDSVAPYYEKIKDDELNENNLIKFDRKIRNIITTYVDQKIKRDVEKRGLTFDDQRIKKLQKKRLTKCMVHALSVYTEINKILVTNDRVDLLPIIWSAYFNRFALPWRNEHGFDMVSTWHGSELYSLPDNEQKNKKKTSVDYLKYANVLAIFNPEKMYLHAAKENSFNVIAMLNAGEYPQGNSYFTDEEKIISHEVVKSAARKASREHCINVLQQMILDGHGFVRKYIDRQYFATGDADKTDEIEVDHEINIDYRDLVADHQQRMTSFGKVKSIASLRDFLPKTLRRSSSDLLDAINDARMHSLMKNSTSRLTTQRSTTIEKADGIYGDSNDLIDHTLVEDILSTM